MASTKSNRVLNLLFPQYAVYAINFSVLKDVKQKLIMSHNCAEEELLSSDTDSEHDAHPLLLEKQIVPNPLVSTASIKELLIQHKRRRTANVVSLDAFRLLLV